ncbi:MAG: SpoIID/LytB domain-containing protein [Acidobacteria bacterium]|nr:SpoIID/LytB domain-containing protein [Acidobacteriota bacterium]
MPVSRKSLPRFAIVIALACALVLLSVESSLSAGLTREQPVIPRTVRVGLLSDQESIQLPCCAADIIAIVGGRTLVAVESIVVRPAVRLTGGGVFRLQIAALHDEEQALQLARTVETALNEPTSIVFDAGTGLYRIRAGKYEDRKAAEAAKQLFNQNNFHDVWVAGEQESLGNPGLEVQRGDRVWVVPGRWLRVHSTSGRGIAMGNRTYRGDLLVYLNDRGTLNLINEVGLDDYLRGVVPREMGPRIYDNLDALKAQAVAARTYTLKNLGEFSEEGYDICATPRCQVYGGMTFEHPLSDQAVLETSAEVLLYDGSYADALYSSTCGGHTENVEVVFPRKANPYLRGVPCLEAGVDRLGRAVNRNLTLSATLVRRLVPSEAARAGASPVAAEDFARRVRRLAQLAGLSTPDDSLASLERREVQRFLASQLGLALDAELFVAPEDVPYLLEEPPSDWDPEDLRLAAYFAQVGLLSAPLEEALTAEASEDTLFQLAVFLRLLEVRDVRYLSRRDSELVVREGSEVHRLELADEFETFRWQGRREEAATLALLPGDRLTIYLHDDRVLALRHSVDPDGVAFDRTSNLRTWTRFRTDSELARLVADRYPGMEFEGFKIQGRGVSGRVSQVEITGAGGQSVTVRGLPIRWTFDLPDTLFTARRLDPPGREGGWLFSGRGWGHGVGLCQVGAYGMAMRGHGYHEILSHYYRGLELVKLGEPIRAEQAVGR